MENVVLKKAPSRAEVEPLQLPVIGLRDDRADDGGGRLTGSLGTRRQKGCA